MQCFATRRLLSRRQKYGEAHRTTKQETGNNDDDVDGRDDPKCEVECQLVAVVVQSAVIALDAVEVAIDPNVATNEPDDEKEGHERVKDVQNGPRTLFLFLLL